MGHLSCLRCCKMLVYRATGPFSVFFNAVHTLFMVIEQSAGSQSDFQQQLQIYLMNVEH